MIEWIEHLKAIGVIKMVLVHLLKVKGHLFLTWKGLIVRSYEWWHPSHSSHNQIQIGLFFVALFVEGLRLFGRQHKGPFDV